MKLKDSFFRYWLPVGASWVFGAGIAFAQPFIPPGGVTNDASNAPTGLPASTIAPGSRFAITGSGLGPAVALTTDSYPLGTSLAGVTVTAASANGTIYNCYPFSVSGDLVRAVLPSTVPPGLAVVRVTYSNQTSNGGTIQVAAHSPGLYSVSATGEGPAQISDYASASGRLISSTVSGGKRLTIGSIQATGLGASQNADNLEPPQQNLPGIGISVLVGGQASTRIVFAGRSTAHPGMDQIIFQVPQSAPLGCYVPVQVLVNGAPSNFVTVALSPNGAACNDSWNPVSSILGQSGTLGLIGLMRNDLALGTGDFIVDGGAYGAWQMPANAFAFSRSISLPPQGACTVYMSSGVVTAASLPPALSTNLIAPGTLNLSGPDGAQAMPGNTPVILGAQNSLIKPNPGPPYLAPGAYTLQSAGSGPAGAFNFKLTLDSPLTWTNQAAVQSVNRSQGVTVQWSNAGSRQVLVAGSAATSDYASSAMFLCVAAAGANSFTVPANVLALLPAVSVNPAAPRGQIGLGAFATGTPAVFTASGLNFAAAAITVFFGQPALYQ